MSISSGPYNAGPPVRKYNQRMARRVARRAHVNEQGVAVCFAFNNLLTSLLIGVVEDVARFVPTVGALIELAIGLLTFYFHRIRWSPIRTCMCIGIGLSTFPASSWPPTRATPAW
jgi:hypothetical protein